MPGRPNARRQLLEAGVMVDVRSPANLAEAAMLLRHNASTRDVMEALEGEVIPAPEEYPPEARTKAEAHARLDAIGLDDVLAFITDGLSQREVCRRVGVRTVHLGSWLADQHQPARVREARRQAAQAWLDRGFAALAEAADPFALAKAREVAAMCRKYAQVLNPSEYSDRVQVEATVESVDDPASIDARMRLLMSTIKGATP